ncbi:MAG: flotillin family protein [Planctomycetes bacterium]|nr:flotillin family protein [Planctomycetota bacterium]
MLHTLTLADLPLGIMLWIGIPVAIILFLTMFFLQRYRRCPSNRILVVYGKTGGQRAAKCIHGGGIMVWPVIQDYMYLSLEPMTIEIDLTSALSKKNIRVNVPSTFTIGISTQPEIMNNAAERLLGLPERDVAAQARDIILGQTRLVIATLSIEEINTDRERFLDLVNKYCGAELNKIGLDVINVNIRDITDESGYIEAIGKKAAAEAINQAKIEVAEANRTGSIGEAGAHREMTVRVAEQQAQAEAGRKQAERDQRIAVAKLESEGVTGEASAKRSQEIAIAEQKARTAEGTKEAEAEQRIKVAELEANAVKGENDSKASIAAYEATLAERQADARRRGDVALANASRDVLLAEKEEEMARLEKEVIAKQMIQRKQIEIEAEAQAEKTRRLAKGEADGILAKYQAEAEGVRAVLEAKAMGYQNLLKICGERVDLAPTLLMVEKMPELVREQVKAIQNLKIDKITVWDSGANGASDGSTANFLKSLIGSLPPMHELAAQAGVELPQVLGHVSEKGDKPSGKPQGK